MERTRISTGATALFTILKFAPIPLLIGSLVVLFTVPERAVGAVFLSVSLFISGVLFFVVKRGADIGTLEYDERFLYIDSKSGNHQIALISCLMSWRWRPARNYFRSSLGSTSIASGSPLT